MKKCKTCGVSKPPEGFYRNGRWLSGECRACRCEAQRVYYAANQDARRKYAEAWRATNPTYAAQQYLANAEKQRQSSRLWKRANRDHQRAMEKARRSLKRRAPKWADRKLMRDIYAYARLMREAGVDCHVDHIVPLKGKTVCGLHVHTNLTVLPAKENLHKGAKLL